MADSTNRPVLRAAAEEFRCVFTFRFAELVPHLATTTLPWRIAAIAWAILLVLWLWIAVAVVRGSMVDWLPAGEVLVGPQCAFPTGTPTADAYISARVAGLVALWAVWGLGGALPVLLSFGAGWAWPRHGSGSQRPHRRRFAHLLPLTSRQLLLAKILGRTAAMLTAMACGFTILALTGPLLVLLGFAHSPPSPFDPWLLACPFIFIALFIATTRNTSDARRWHATVATSRSTGIVIYVAILLFTVAYTNGLHLRGHWSFPGYSALAAAGIALIALLQWARAPKPPAAVALDRPPSRLRDLLKWWNETIAGRGLMFALPPATGSILTRRWLSRNLPFAGACCVIVTLLSAVVQLAPVAWSGLSHLLATGRLPAGPLQSTEDALALGLGLVPFIFAGLIIWQGASAWPEPFVPTGRSGPQVPRGPTLGVLPHLGLSLPIRARTRWSRRLVALAGMCALMIAAAILSYWLASSLAASLLPLGFTDISYAIHDVLLCLILAALSLFALMPLIGLAAKSVTVSSCLLWGLSMAFLFAGIILTPALHMDPSAERFFALPGLLLPTHAALTALLLLLSWIFCEPSLWRRAADGSPTIGSKLLAAGTQLLTAFTFGYLATTSFLLMGIHLH